jgi:Arc/MetJ-type ribon-helix-helix transcriptional regulator
MITKPRRRRLTERFNARVKPDLAQAVLRYAGANGYKNSSEVMRAALTALLTKEGFLKGKAVKKRR